MLVQKSGYTNTSFAGRLSFAMLEKMRPHDKGRRANSWQGKCKGGDQLCSDCGSGAMPTYDGIRRRDCRCYNPVSIARQAKSGLTKRFSISAGTSTGTMLAVLLFLVAAERPAHAYTDPGSG